MPIRLKIAIISTLSAIVLVGGAGLLFLTTLASGLQNSLDNTLRNRAADLSAQVNPDGSVTSPGTAGRLRLVGGSYGQVLSAGGVVIDSSAETLSRPLLSAAELGQVRPGGRFFNARIREASTDPKDQSLRILAVPLAGNHAYVAVATGRDVVDDAVDRAGKQLLVLGFVTIVLAAGGGWMLTSGALRPVERMRAQAAELEARDLGGGLTVPSTRDEVGRLATTFNALLARLHSALERERAFVADAGHELRTPLTVLKGELELAGRPGRTHEELQATVSVAAEETERLIRLAENLLILARDGAVTARRVPFDLMPVVGAACARAETLAARRGVRIECAGPDELVVWGDHDQIRQAVDNVLANALRFAPDASSITLDVGRRDDTVTVEVADRGPGFPEAFLPHAFERFRRGDAVRTRSADGDGTPVGAGLGLAIVRSLLRGHGGDASAANRREGGAVITLSWPAGEGETLPLGAPSPRPR